MQPTDQAPILGANYVPNTPDPAPTPTVPTPTEPTDTSTPPPAPTTNLKPGSTGSDVGALQSYLVQMGYLTPDQVGTGSGTYGPQTTAAVAKMQQDLGVNAGNAKGFYGPQTQAAISQKYNSYFQSKQGTSAPDNAGLAKSQITAQTQQSSDPIFGALTSSFQPIMDSLTQVMSNINNPALTGVSLQQEYNDLATQYNLPGMNAQLMNMQNVMNGTTDDIRSEITKAGGTATESQVMGLSAARNTVIQKQYNALATQYQSAQQNVQNMMQYASSDQATELQKQSMSASIVESMGSLQQQMVSMGMTMQSNARSAAQYNISQTGYQAFAKTLQGNPQMQSQYENLLALAPGTLSDPQALAALDTYKDQTQQLNIYKAGITAYNAGYSPASVNLSGQYGTATSTVSQLTGIDPNTPLSQVDAGTLTAAMMKNEGSSPQGVINNPGNIKFVGLPGQTNSGVKASDGGTFASYATPQAGQQAITANIQSAMQKNPNQTLGAFVDRYTNTAPTQTTSNTSGQIGTTPVDPSTLIRPSFIDNKVPLTLSADQMEKYMNAQTAASVDPGTHNIVAPGVGYYVQQSDGSYVLKSALPSPVGAQYDQIKQTIASAPPFKGSPTVTRKWTLAANAAISSYKDTGTYKVLSNVAPYLDAIDAAMKQPGSVGDIELLDSYVKASKGGTGQVTDTQVDTILRGSSLADNYDRLSQKLKNGGVLSTKQRNDLYSLASGVYNENANTYKQIYVQAIQNMQGQGIPIHFWSNLPDFASFITLKQ